MSSTRVPELDGLRGIAVLLIVVFHTMILMPFELPPIYKTLYSWMWTGVTIFFVLSGYLITQILIRTSGNQNYFLNFFLRRAFRIFPAYYATLIAIFLVAPFLSEKFSVSMTRQDFWLYAVYLQNWSFALNGWPDWYGVAHFWSLAVEEQFYLMWPLVILLTGVRRAPAVCLAFIVAALITSVLVTLLGKQLPNILMGGTKIFLHTSTITAMAAIAAGALVASLDVAQLRRYGSWLTVMGVSGVFIVLVIQVSKSDIWGFAEMQIRIGIIMLTTALLGGIKADIAPGWLCRLLSGKTLVRAGIHSYSIYLIHYPLLILVKEQSMPALVAVIEPYPVFASMVLVLLSIAMCWLAALPLFYFVETRFMELRNRIHENGAWNSNSTTGTDLDPDTTFEQHLQSNVADKGRYDHGFINR